jgi:putative membrane protein
MAYITALHIIFVVCWFAGLFYIVRLFIYSYEANLKPEPERGILLTQFQIMKKRLLYGITWPAGILTIVFGTWRMLYFGMDYFFEFYVTAWFILKMTFVGLLILYHMQCQILFRQQTNNIFKFNSLKLRFFNEIATVVLFAVVFLVEVQRNTNWVYGILGAIILAGLIILGISLYNQQRIKDEKQDKNDQEPPVLPPNS